MFLKSILLFNLYVSTGLSLFLLGCQNHSEDEKISLSESTDYSHLRSSGSLANPFDWIPLRDAMDPFFSFFSDDASLNTSCLPEAHGIEEVSVGVWSYFIETEECHWLTLKQKLPFPLFVGDRIQLKIWHFDLNAPQRAVAHIGLSTDQENIIWVEEAIPQESRMIKEEGLISYDVLPGQWLYFHLDNHGANSWHLLEISLLLDEIKD